MFWISVVHVLKNQNMDYENIEYENMDYENMDYENIDYEIAIRSVHCS